MFSLLNNQHPHFLFLECLPAVMSKVPCSSTRSSSWLRWREPSSKGSVRVNMARGYLLGASRDVFEAIGSELNSAVPSRHDNEGVDHVHPLQQIQQLIASPWCTVPVNHRRNLQGSKSGTRTCLAVIVTKSDLVWMCCKLENKRMMRWVVRVPVDRLLIECGKQRYCGWRWRPFCLEGGRPWLSSPHLPIPHAPNAPTDRMSHASDYIKETRCNLTYHKLACPPNRTNQKSWCTCPSAVIMYSFYL